MTAQPTASDYELSAEQRAAAQYVGGPLQIVAGAGTGKTSTLTARFVHLVQHHGVPAHEILAVTFSAKAAGEMKNRIVTALGGNHRRLWIQTFHGLCLRLLGEWARADHEPDPRVLSDIERRRYARRAIDSIPVSERRYYHRDHGSRIMVGDLLAYADRCCDDLIDPDNEDRGAHQSSRRIDLNRALVVYRDLLSADGAYDFGTLNVATVRMLESDPARCAATRARFQHMLVDEFQDTNHAQFRLLELLVPAGNQVCVVGDANQAIYAFRGGQSAYFERFTERFPRAKSFKLQENYRSGPEILTAANNLVRHNETGTQLQLISMQSSAPAIVSVTTESTPEQEAESVARRILAITSDRSKDVRFNDIAVLFRSVRTQVEPFQRAFSLYGIPYSQGPVLGLDYAIRHDLRAALNLIQNGPDWPDAARLALGRGGRALDRQTLERTWTADQLLARISDPEIVEEQDGPGLFLQIVKGILDQAKTLDTDQSSLLFYNTMQLTGHLNESIDPAQARQLGELLNQTRTLSSAADLATLLGSGPSEFDDQVPDVRHGVQLLTVHAAKGLEWPVVFVVGLAEGIFPLPVRANREADVQSLSRSGVHSLDLTAQHLESFTQDHVREERRLAYVAVTRAKRELHLSRSLIYGLEPREPSRFLTELGYAEPESAPIDDEYVRLTNVFALGRDIRSRQRRALQVLPERDESSLALADLLLAQWAAGRVPGVNPIRDRRLPNPYSDESSISFSASELESYDACPKKYLYGALLKLEREDHGVHALVGTAVHAVLERLNHFRLETGTIPSDEFVTGLFDEAWPSVGFDLAIQSTQFRKRAEVMVRRYLQFERGEHPERIPVWIEKYARVPYRNHEVRGKVDLVMRNADGSYHLMDYKTGSTSGYTTSRQLYLYVHMWRQENPAALEHPLLVSLVGLKHDDDKGTELAPNWKTSQLKSIKLTAQWLAEREDEVEMLLSGIASNQFPGDPSACARCDFIKVCPDAS